MAKPVHIPVMCEAVIAALSPKAGEVYVDGTFGNGGYSKAALGAADCRVLGIDRDPNAISRGEDLAQNNARFTMFGGVFSDLKDIAEQAGQTQVDGVMLDIGVSSMQIDQAERGFSFQKQGPLDMRMGGNGFTAADVVNSYAENQIADILYLYGEERASRRIARAICTARTTAKIETTQDLVDIIDALGGGRAGQKIHPATRTFQALRIFVNDELGELVKVLSAAERLLREGGRLIVVSFHSLEDRLVKTFFNSRSARQRLSGSRFIPDDMSSADLHPSFSLPHKKPVLPTDAETASNPRARSAKLRYAVRTSAPALGEFVPDRVSTNHQLEARWS